MWDSFTKGRNGRSNYHSCYYYLPNSVYLFQDHNSFTCPPTWQSGQLFKHFWSSTRCLSSSIQQNRGWGEWLLTILLFLTLGQHCISIKRGPYKSTLIAAPRRELRRRSRRAAVDSHSSYTAAPQFESAELEEPHSHTPERERMDSNSHSSMCSKFFNLSINMSQLRCSRCVALQFPHVLRRVYCGTAEVEEGAAALWVVSYPPLKIPFNCS